METPKNAHAIRLPIAFASGCEAKRVLLLNKKRSLCRTGCHSSGVMALAVNTRGWFLANMMPLSHHAYILHASNNGKLFLK